MIESSGKYFKVIPVFIEKENLLDLFQIIKKGEISLILNTLI